MVCLQSVPRIIGFNEDGTGMRLLGASPRMPVTLALLVVCKFYCPLCLFKT
jgi:hypothetical protein